MIVKSYRLAFNCNMWHPTKHDWLLVASFIQQEEKERIGKFHFKRDAKCAMAGRLLITNFITTVTGLPWSDIKIDREEHGKPVYRSYVNQNDELKIDFNISHHGHYTVLAGEVSSSDTKVGIDVMRYQYRTGKKYYDDFKKLMARQLSSYELDTISQLCGTNEQEVTKMFYRMWCLKESYLKAIGVGITLDLREVSFQIKSPTLSRHTYVDDTELYYKNERMDDWSFQETLLDDETCLAVACSPKARPPYEKFQFLSSEELIKGAEEIIPPDEQYAEQFTLKAEYP